MAVKRRYSLTPEGWVHLQVTAVILVAALIRDINLLMVLFSILTGLIVLNWRFVAVILWNLEVKRSVPDRVAAGESFDVQIEVRNPRRSSSGWMLRIEDRISQMFGERPGPFVNGSALMAHVPARGTGTASYRVRLSEPGRYRLGPIDVSTRFPLGLVRRTQTFDVPAELIAWPRLGRLTPAWKRRHQTASFGSRATERQLGLVEADFHGLRDWRSGDSRRWIHWRTSARKANLMVRQFERQHNEDMILLVDLWEPVAGEPVDPIHQQLALSFAATVLTDACRQGMGSLSFGVASRKPVLIRGAATNALLHTALDALSVAEPGPDDTLPALISQALEHCRRGTSAIIVGPRPVELDDQPRFSGLTQEATQRIDLGSIITVDTSCQAELSDYFVPL